MKPKKHDLNLKHQRAIARKLSKPNKDFEEFVKEQCDRIKMMALLDVGDPVSAFNRLEEQIVIRESLKRINKDRRKIHVDNSKPEEIVKANPRPAFNGELVIQNGAPKKVTTVPDKSSDDDGTFDLTTTKHESTLPLIVESKTATKVEQVTMPCFLAREFQKEK